MRTPKLKANEFSGEGDVEFPANWPEHDLLLRADLLNDWIGQLTETYNRTVAELENSVGLPPSDPDVKVQ